MTKTPCPGCNLIDPNRPAKSICSACKKKLAYAEEMAAAATSTEMVYRWQLQHNSQMKLTHYIKSEVHRLLADCLSKIAIRLSKKEFKLSAKYPTEDSYIFRSDWQRSVKQTLYLTKSDVDLLRSLEKKLSEATKLAHDAGEESGQSFVVRMAKGEFSQDYINKTIMKKNHE